MLDPMLQAEQYGFRTNRSASDAIHCIRRAMEYGEKTWNNEILILLDWEKAFVKVSHEAIDISLQRLKTHPKYRRIIKDFYNNPEYYFELEDVRSKN